MAHIVKVQVLQGFTLRITFDDGFVRTIDLRSMLTGPVFAPLRDRRRFRAVRINRDYGCIEWPNGADLCPDALYYGHISNLAGKLSSKDRSAMTDLCINYNNASNAKKRAIAKMLSLMVKNQKGNRKKLVAV